MGSPTDPETLTLEALVDRYTEAAARWGENASDDHEVANEAAQEVAALYRELRRRDPDARRVLLPLLESPDVGVRLWAACHALEFRPEDGERVLEKIKQSTNSVLRLNAQMTLRQWKSGTLRFP